MKFMESFYSEKDALEFMSNPVVYMPHLYKQVDGNNDYEHYLVIYSVKSEVAMHS
jgi:hypothetical protein